ncbi:formyl transferase domain protein [Gemmatirosa kalamazoonensis]|uniref:Formyl transferase domain protein n=1 Tax=Gemmatirosa kalamazoonensis TaxID=861299 RepID=W0RHF0_9BACT|nr:formyltransferase family protein [Gemmatirosa kalamazoonensis]AHG90554.1 formyl transferase domain protein [Gemmatirosa kalamazoonensis]
MIPFDLAPRRLEVPAHTEPTIVVVTGAEPRHVRFALRMQQAFGTDVVAWYQLTRPPSAPPPAPPAAPPAPEPLLRRARRAVRRALGRRPPVAPEPPASIFLEEIEVLRPHAVVPPRLLPASEANGDTFVRELRALRPCFLLTLGGGLYGRDVLESVRGLPINQHAGYSPDYKGNQTTYQALYHRDLRRVASTVHVTTTGVDAGPILRRSTPCLTPSDSVQTVMERVVALGTELMIECVREIRDTGSILAFDQPLDGVTYLARECDAHVRGAVHGDFGRGWLGAALRRRRAW